jgi:hypothetical protein
LGKFPQGERGIHRRFIRRGGKIAELRRFLELARPLLILWHPPDRPSDRRKRELTVYSLNNKLAAAAFSLAFSLIMFATAIAPANGGMLLPGALA